MVAGLCHFVFSPEITPREKTKIRKDATRKGEKTPREKTPCEKTKDAMRKDEITPREKTKRRHAKRRKDAMRKDERTPSEKTKRRNNAKKTKSHTRKDDKLTVLNGVFLRGVFFFFFFFFFFVFSCWNFDFPRGGFRYFIFLCGVISSLSIFHGVISSFHLFAWCLFVFSRGVISGQKDEMAQYQQWVAKEPSFLHADSEDSDQTWRMSRLTRVFAGRTGILLVLSWGGSYEQVIKD